MTTWRIGLASAMCCIAAGASAAEPAFSDRLRVHIGLAMGVGPLDIRVDDLTPGALLELPTEDATVGVSLGLDVPLTPHLSLGSSVSVLAYNLASELAPAVYLDFTASVRGGLPILEDRGWVYLSGGLGLTTTAGHRLAYAGGRAWHVAANLGIDYEVTDDLGVFARIGWKRRVFDWSPDVSELLYVRGLVVFDEATLELGLFFPL